MMTQASLKERILSILTEATQSPLVTNFKQHCDLCVRDFALESVVYSGNDKSNNDTTITAVMTSPDKHVYTVTLTYDVRNNGRLTATVKNGKTGHVEQVQPFDIKNNQGWFIYFGENYLRGHMNHKDLEGDRVKRLMNRQRSQ
jgi:hypothetical protein